jgi:hypothetical protein
MRKNLVKTAMIWGAGGGIGRALSPEAVGQHILDAHQQGHKGTLDLA